MSDTRDELAGLNGAWTFVANLTGSGAQSQLLVLGARYILSNQAASCFVGFGQDATSAGVAAGSTKGVPMAAAEKMVVVVNSAASQYIARVPESTAGDLRIHRIVAAG